MKFGNKNYYTQEKFQKPSENFFVSTPNRIMTNTVIFLKFLNKIPLLQTTNDTVCDYINNNGFNTTVNTDIVIVTYQWLPLHKINTYNPKDSNKS